MQTESKKSASITAGLLRGEEWAFTEMYKSSFPSVSILVKKNSGTQEDAKDIFQEALLVLVQKLRDSSFKLTAQPKTFLYSVARNIWYKRLRSQKNKPEDLVLDEDESLIQISEEDEQLMSFELDGFDENDRVQQLAKQKLAKLSDICREVIVMKYVHGMSHQEIMMETGDSLVYARQRLFNCMNQLRKSIRKEL